MSEKETVTIKEPCPKCDEVGYLEKVAGVRKLCPLCHGLQEIDLVFDKSTKLQIIGGLS